MGNKMTKKSLIIQTIIVFSLCLLLVVLIGFQFARIWDLRDRQAEIDEKISQIQQENATYSDELDYYLSDDYLEDVAHLYNKKDSSKIYY